ncbi:hypothetical protein ES708_21270 [subsurface metagenome]
MGTIIFRIIKMAVRAITPELRNVLVGALNSLEKAAASTPSEWDDILVQILKSLLGSDDDTE